MRILITGGTGTIGSAVAERLMAYNPDAIIILSNDEDGLYHARNTFKSAVYQYVYADVRDAVKLSEVFGGVDVVFHCAAMKHVPACEADPGEAVKTNILGTQNVIRECKKHGCGFVLISTDKAVNPTSVMGITKLLAERLTVAAGFRVVRFGNVLRSRGSVIPLWESQAEGGRDVTITDKRMRRYFMEISEAVDLIMWAWLEGYDGCIHVLKMEELSVYDLARKIADRHCVSVIETGVRPGEKLREELMTDSERSRASTIGVYTVVRP